MRSIFRQIPGARYAVLRFLQRRCAARRLPAWIAWNTSLKRWQSYRRFTRLHNVHRGQRCFIVGNGPSLNQTDLSLLRGEYTFTTNRAYLIDV